MTVFTITVSDITKTVQSLATLLAGGTIAGYSIAPSIASKSVLGAPGVLTQAQYISLQSSYQNGTKKIYKGDENVKTDGTCQAKEMAAGDVDVMTAGLYALSLNEIYITASANGAICNVEVHY